MADFKHYHFPFTAVAGQDSLKLALTLTAINPRIGGVLISGPRGSAKSTLARGLADVMPTQGEQSTPFVTLPLGATEDRLLGSLDIESVLQDKQAQFRPGLLAAAHQGILYVDEVNLLPDGLVDQLLDVSASGVNRVERDGVSHQHASQFVLVGTMNPEEGALRPQLQDRFGLMVTLSNQYSLEERVQIVRLRDEYDQDNQGFFDAFKYKQRNLRLSINQARERLSEIKCADALRMDIASRCQDARVDGVRADIVWVRAAMAHAAWRGAQTVSIDDVLAVESFVLAHRRQNASTPPASPPPSSAPSPSRRPSDSLREGSAPGKSSTSAESESSAESDWGAMPKEAQSTVHTSGFFKPLVTPVSEAASSTEQATVGKRKGKTLGGQQRANSSNHVSQVDWSRTLQTSAGVWPPKTLKFKPNKSGAPVLHLLLLDTSGSTLAEQGFGRTKGLIEQISNAAYLKREQVTLMGFGGDSVETLLEKRRAPSSLLAQLDTLSAGGGTPINKALEELGEYIERQQKQQSEQHITVYILTDGRVSGALDVPSLPTQTVVIDIEQASVKRGRAKELATALGADYLPLEDCLQ
ncbi:AAA family ATPase [Rhodanobacter aciditrophus]|uniref:AAA family ATPase n=1 Tax=Rhodanobacter aciditrophus TaxID=1623218 RepID=A0ABW4AXA7_9GAMM